MYKLGFMQGRLSPVVNGKIQAFPSEHWQQEFAFAKSNEWELMEWTIDDEGFDENPVMTSDGQALIQKLMRQYNLAIPSATADFIMQAPFYKQDGKAYDDLLGQLKWFLDSSSKIGIKYIVVPLVDNGRLTSNAEEKKLISGLEKLNDSLLANEQVIVFESDYSPGNLYEFILNFPDSLYGINYDSGNSASLGFDVKEEFDVYGTYIKNVHIKDRCFQGATVPLGEGNVDFKQLFSSLKSINYQGNLIFQTARAKDDNHAATLNTYREFIKRVM